MDDRQGMQDEGPLPFSAMGIVARAPVRMFRYANRPNDDEQYIGPVISGVPELEERADPANALGMDLHNFVGVLWGASNELLQMIRPLQEVAGDLPGIVSASNTVHGELEAQIAAVEARLVSETGARVSSDAAIEALDEELAGFRAQVALDAAVVRGELDEADGRLGALEDWRGVASGSLLALGSRVDGVSSRAASLEGWRSTATGRLNAIEAWQVPVQGRLDVLETSDRGQDSRIDAVNVRAGQAIDAASTAQSSASSAVTSAGVARSTADGAAAAASQAKSSADAASVAASLAASVASSASSTASQAKTVADAAQSTATTASVAALAAQQAAATLQARSPVVWRAVGNLPTLAIGATADVLCPWVSVPSTLPTVAQCAPVVGPTLGSTTAPVVKSVSASGVTVTIKAGLTVTAAVGALTVTAVTW